VTLITWSAATSVWLRLACMLSPSDPSNEEMESMKVWIDQDLCTGDGLCEEIAPDVFTLLDDGLAYVREGDKIYAAAKGNPQGAEGMASFPDNKLDAVIESAEECPGECIFIEP
jgi:ferredoxin